MGMNALEVRRRVMLAQPHEAVASGAVASFVTDVKSPLPMEFDLLPIQDLHGQTNPYPPGGGANKWDEEKEYGRIDLTTGEPVADNGYYRSKNFCACLPNTDYYGKATESPSTFVVAFYDSTKNFVSYLATSSARNKAFTTPVNAYFFKIYFSANAINGIAINYPSTVTTYAPYSNICPITGHDGFTRTGTGGNVFGGMPLAEAIHDASYTGNIDTENKTVTFTRGKQQQDGTYANNLFDKFKPNKQYTVIITAKLKDGSGTQNTSLLLRYSDNTNKQVPVTSTDKTTYVITSDSAKSVDWFELNYYSSRICDVYYEESGIFEGVLTADQFAAYSGHSYSTTFPTPPGTVYGGHVTDNGDGTYDLTVDRARLVIDGAGTFGNYESTTEYAHIPMIAPSQSRKNQGAIQCDILPQNGSKPYANTGMGVWQGASLAWYICINKALLDADNKESFVAWLASNQPNCIYYLATPVVYTLTLTALQSLIGQNHIWVDNADSVSVEYWGH